MQGRLDVGETRPPEVLDRLDEVSMGSIVQMVMCAHRIDPQDVEGWLTHDPDDVAREWVQQNVEATVSRILGDEAADHSTRSSAYVPLEEKLDAMRDEDDTEQAALVADGGRDQCPECGEPVDAVLRVASIGTRGEVAVKGTVHAVASSDPRGWILYVHGGEDGGA